MKTRKVVPFADIGLLHRYGSSDSSTSSIAPVAASYDKYPNSRSTLDDSGNASDGTTMDDGGAAGRPRARRVLEAVALALVALAAWGCGTGSNPATLGDTPSTMPDGSSGPSCATPNTDCPCSSDGAQVACGEVVSRSGDYVTCSEGTRTCMGGSWSVCASQYLTTKSVSVQSGGIHVLNINPAVACGDSGVPRDLCDPAPSCMGFVDDPSGLDAGADSGLVINEAGVTLYGTPVPAAQCSGLTVMPNTPPGKDLTITSISTTTGAPSPSTLQ